MSKDFEELQGDVLAWASDRKLLDPSGVLGQLAKLLEESGELARGVLKDDSDLIVDSLGDVLVVLTILSEQLGLDLVECLDVACECIKDRTGSTVNGVFVKVDPEEKFALWPTGSE